MSTGVSKAFQRFVVLVKWQGAVYTAILKIKLKLGIMGIITATDIAAKLQAWASGELDAAAVHDWAEDRYAIDEWEPESDSVNEVLARLDMLDMNLTTKEDIPALLAALNSKNAAQLFEAHDASIDVEARKSKLAGTALYAPFCK